MVSEDVIVVSRCFQIVGAATEKARRPLLSLVLGTKICLETDDLRVPEIPLKCNRLTNYVSC